MVQGSWAGAGSILRMVSGLGLPRLSLCVGIPTEDMPDIASAQRLASARCWPTWGTPSPNRLRGITLNPKPYAACWTSNCVQAAGPVTIVPGSALSAAMPRLVA